MRSFFESMPPWPRNDGSLHVYVLPDQATAERLSALQERVSGVENLPVMPRAWLHFTVSRLPQWDDLGGPALTRLADALGAELASVSPMVIEVGAPAVRDLAVECEAPRTPAWDALVEAVRRAAWSLDGGVPPSEPQRPHISLAYATGEVDSEAMRRRLDGAAPVGALTVAEVHLCSVTVRPELGTFDWVELANWSLGQA